MAISRIPFHPLDVIFNRRYKVTEKPDPNIEWYTPAVPATHHWEGYIRVPKDNTYTFSMTVDDNGFIEIGGEKLVEVSGPNSSITKTGSKYLKRGYHYARFQHVNTEVPEAIAPYPNAEEFVVKMGEEKIKLWEIDAPKNLWSAADSQRLLSCYNVVDYLTMPSANQVYAYIGGWLNKAHLEEIANNVPMNDRKYYDSCALRLSIALSSYGKDMENVPGTNHILKDGNSAALGGRKHVILSAGSMANYLHKLLGEEDYTTYPFGDEEDGYFTPQPGDIIVFASNVHGGMSPGGNDDVGGGFATPIWLLYRANLDE